VKGLMRKRGFGLDTSQQYRKKGLALPFPSFHLVLKFPMLDAYDIDSLDGKRLSPLSQAQLVDSL